MRRGGVWGQDAQLGVRKETEMGGCAGGLEMASVAGVGVVGQVWETHEV